MGSIEDKLDFKYLVMLETILVYAIVCVLIKVVEKPLVKKIAFSKNTEDAISIRRMLIALRIGISILLFGGYLLCIVAIGDFDNPNASKSVEAWKSVIMTIAFIFIVGIQQLGFKKLLGNISCLTKTAFLSAHENFVLFLRGFNDDDYSDITEIRKDHFEKFSEYGFMSLLEVSKISACAIGMTKESDSPIGAKRIYVDDNSWKEDVNELIEKARDIFILVRDRESCIWEIEKSLVHLSKVQFIVDDIDIYNNVREKIKGKIELPQIEIAPVGAIVVISYKDGTFIAALYSNSINGYAQILQYPQDKLDKFKKKHSKKRTAVNFLDKKLLIFAVIACLVVMAVNFYIEYDNVVEEEKERLEKSLLGEGASLSEKDKQTIFMELQLQYRELAKKCPLQLDDYTILKDIHINGDCLFAEYEIKGLEIEDVDMVSFKLHIIAGINKKQLAIYKMLAIDILYRYSFGNDVREIKITKEEINKIYENLIKTDEQI